MAESNSARRAVLGRSTKAKAEGADSLQRDKQSEAVLLSVEGALADGDTELEDVLYDSYTFDGEASQVIQITLASDDFDTFLVVLDASANLLAQNDDGSDRTNIALAPGQGEDGLLTAAEIFEELTLQADLVVLSACDTGLGTITGDGVVGLSRSLIAAGASSVVVSLWSVPDAPTAELMAAFYSQLQQGKNKAQALRQATLLTMRNNPDPKDWAAFTLIGSAE